MTHSYKVIGMTCNGCVAKVKSELLKMSNVLSVEVQLTSPQATIRMDKHIATAALQQAIGDKYTITDIAGEMPMQTVESAPEQNSYYPIFLIFGYITGTSLLVEYSKGSFTWMSGMSTFMAGFFLLFSFFKLLNLKAFAVGYSTYDIIAKRVHAYGFIYPFIELALGMAYLTGWHPLVTNLITIVVMGVSSIGVLQSLLRKTNFQCACLGTIIKLPLSKVTLFEDLLMVAMSVAALFIII